MRAIDLIIAERDRQKNVHGYTEEHDDATYGDPFAADHLVIIAMEELLSDPSNKRPHSLSELVKASALLLARIEWELRNVPESREHLEQIEADLRELETGRDDVPQAEPEQARWHWAAGVPRYTTRLTIPGDVVVPTTATAPVTLEELRQHMRQRVDEITPADRVAVDWGAGTAAAVTREMFITAEPPQQIRADEVIPENGVWRVWGDPPHQQELLTEQRGDNNGTQNQRAT